MKIKTGTIIAAIACLTLSAGQCQQKSAQVSFDMQRVPKHYRDCVEKVMALPTGTITRAEAVQLIAKLRQSELRLSTCGKGVIRWADAQYNAYVQAVGR